MFSQGWFPEQVFFIILFLRFGEEAIHLFESLFLWGEVSKIKKLYNYTKITVFIFGTIKIKVLYL